MTKKAQFNMKQNDYIMIVISLQYDNNYICHYLKSFLNDYSHIALCTHVNPPFCHMSIFLLATWKLKIIVKQ